MAFSKRPRISSNLQGALHQIQNWPRTISPGASSLNGCRIERVGTIANINSGSKNKIM